MTKRRRLWKNGIKAIFGDKCQDCGYDKHWEILEFHHVIPRNISGRPSMAFIQDWKWERFRDEHLEHCVLLCPTCHRSRHFEDEHDSLKYTHEIDF
jgi:5-methylcytosine-specific restriction endonuclease McrA